MTTQLSGKAEGKATASTPPPVQSPTPAPKVVWLSGTAYATGSAR